MGTDKLLDKCKKWLRYYLLFTLPTIFVNTIYLTRNPFLGIINVLGSGVISLDLPILSLIITPLYLLIGGLLTVGKVDWTPAILIMVPFSLIIIPIAIIISPVFLAVAITIRMVNYKTSIPIILIFLIILKLRKKTGIEEKIEHIYNFFYTKYIFCYLVITSLISVFYTYFNGELYNSSGQLKLISGGIFEDYIYKINHFIYSTGGISFFNSKHSLDVRFGLESSIAGHIIATVIIGTYMKSKGRGNKEIIEVNLMITGVVTVLTLCAYITDLIIN